MVTLSSAMDDYKKLTSATSKTTTLPTNTTSSTSSTSQGITLDSALSDLSKLTGKTYANTTDISSPMPITKDANLKQKSGFWRNIFQKSSYFDDGWQAGDVLATVWDTGKSAASSVAEGFLNTVEGIADFGQYTLADVVDFFGATQAAENIRENAKFNSTGAIFGKNTSASDNLFQPKWKENLDQRSVLGTSGRQIAEGVGNVGALIGSSYLGGQIIGGAIPGAATSGFGQATWAEIGASSFGSYSSAYGNTVSRELNTGTSMEDARKAGVVSGFAEAISEQFFNSMAGMHTAGLGETIFGKVVPKTVNESVKKFFNTKAGKVASAIIDGLEEGSEEILSNIFTAIGNDIAYAVDPTYQVNGMDTQTGNAWEDLKAQFKNTETWDAFWSAALTSAILSGAQTMIPNKQRQELIDAYAEDNNLTKEEAQSRLDGQQQIEGQDNQTIEKTIYSNVNTNMTIDEINAITNVDDINDLISQLQEELAQDRDTRTMSRSDLEPIANLLKTALDRQTQLIEEMKIPEQTDTFKDSLDELENINENPEITPEAKLAKNTEVQATADAIDKETTIKIADNKKGVRVRYNQVEQDAISYINQVNVQRTATGQAPITIIQNPTQDQLRLADALEAFGRHAVFARDLPGSFVTPSTDVNPNLGQVLFINDKISTGLLAKSNITNKNQPLVYAIGHEMFHSLRQTEPGVYDNFVEYVANTISNEQILQFMEMYDPIDSQGLLEGLQINGQYNLDEILKDPKKYTSQYQSLLNIAEEMTANEFGGMFTDVDYMTNLATQNKSLFERIVEAIKNFFKDIDKPIYNSPLTHYQISTIRQNFEDIINNVNNSLSTTAGLMNEIQSTRSGHQATNDVQNQETMQKTQQKTANKTPREQKPKSTRQTSEQKTTWADVTKAYDIANRSDEISSVTNLREVYDKYLKDGGKQDAEFETLIDGLENTFKTPNSTRQKEEKFTQQVNLSGQVQKSTRQVLKKETTQKTKLPIKETPVEQPAYIKSFDNDVRSDGSNAYFVFEDVVSDNTLTQEELKDLKEHAVKVAKTKEIKDDIRNWTPEIMNQEQQEIQSLESKAIDSTKSNKTLPNLYDRARQQYDILLESGLDSAREKAKQYYQEYKDAGGRRKISGLEEQESSLPRKELNINDEVKTSSMTNDAWFTNIEKMYDTYNKSTPADKQKRRAGLITAYANYRQKGGTQIIEELENIITSKENTEETKENLFNTMVDAKYLPNTSSEYLEDKPKDKKVSKFFSNTVTNSPFAEDVFSILRTNYDMKYYEALSDEQSLENGKRNIAENGEQAVYTLLGKDSLDKNDTATAVLLLSYYKATKNYALQEAIFNKFRPEATKSGQFIQSLKMLKYLSPEVLINSLQTELDNFEETMKESRDPLLQAWIREEFNRDNLKLTEAEKLWIESMWERANKLDPDSNEYKVVMAQVYAYVANKIPKSLTTKIKDFRRVGMLANIKTQGRNALSNVFALPVNILSDFFGSRLDKRLASKTGMRTQGTFRAGQFMEGAREGAREAIRDYKLGINTQNMNAYERQTGKTFSDNNFVGRGLNKITDATTFGLDMGDRPIELGWESNALANIMDLNGHEVASELDKRLAEEEATEKVWKNKGKMAELAIGTRNTLNKIHIGNLGLGDMILPFVLTPANLAAATYKYSPAAVLSVAKNALDFNNTIKNNAPFEEKVLAQKKLVDSVGRMTAGTVLYAIAYAIAKAGKITGDEDDDKDVAAMMQSMGWQKYSIKIGDTYVSYDWAEPFANPFAVMAEIQRQRENGEFKNNDELSNALQIIAQAFKIGGTRLQDQSFLSSLQSIFSGQDSIAEGLIDFAAGLPASFVPTALKQVADIADGTAKMTYDKTSMANTALNKMLVKIPGAKSLLPTKQTTLGNDARKYKEIEHIGDLFMRMFNSAISPASVSTDTSGEIGDEFFDVYNHAGDATIMPQIAIKNISYDSDNDGETEKYQFTLEQQSQLQKDMGKIVTDGMNDLMFNDTYNTATYEQKATALTSLVQYAKGKALEQSGYVPNYQIKSGNAAQINNYTNQGLSVGEAVMYDSIINAIKADKDAAGETVKGSQNGKKAYTIMNMPISDNSKDVMLHLISPNSTTPETTDSLSNLRTEDEFISYYSLGRHDSFVNNKFSRDDVDVATNYFNFDVVNFTQYANELASIRSDKDANGNAVTNSKKRKIIEYLNTLPLNPIQKTYLYGLSGYSLKAYQNDLFNYINGLNISAEEKKKVWSELGFSA